MPPIPNVAPGQIVRASDQNDLIDRVNENTVTIESIVSGSTAVPFTFTQVAPAASWSGTHGLNRVPRAVVVDSSGQVLIADVFFPTPNTFVVVHGQPTSGAVHLL